jgi:hypothetical protein
VQRPGAQAAIPTTEEAAELARTGRHWP